jgi:hypothetical protein
MEIDYGTKPGRGLSVLFLLDALRWQENERRKTSRQLTSSKKGKRKVHRKP